MNYKLSDIALHITESCTHSCPMCYATEEGTIRQHGDLEVLKKIVLNAAINGVDSITLVGGDPCDYPHLVELLEYIKIVGEEIGRVINVDILSNTHVYRKNGKEVPIETIVPLVTSLEVTLHGPTPEEHNKFCGREHAYEDVISRLEKYDKLRDAEHQGLGIVVNMMPQTYSRMFGIVENVKSRLNIEYLMLQRIAPTGRACGQTCYALNQQQLDETMNAIYNLSNNFPDMEIVFCDTVPYCAVDEDKRKFLLKGGCNWGEEIVAVKMNGDITRCAMGSNTIGNFLDFNTQDKFNDFWNNNMELNACRNRVHLTPKCLECKNYKLCRGGCVMAGKKEGTFVGDPYSGNGQNPVVIEDYLSEKTR